MSGLDFSAEASLSAGASFSASVNLSLSTSESNLKIISYASPSDHDPSSSTDEYIVDLNPNTFTINNPVTYENQYAIGQAGGDPVFKLITPLQLTISFTVDGTGVTKSKVPNSAQKGYVVNNIKKLRQVTGSEINGEIHRTNYLAVLWGKMYIECVLTNLNIVYNLFDREGAPLRAKVTCNFMERFLPSERTRHSRMESSDLTKYRMVQEGDILPLIAKRNYDSSAYYLQLARVNKLKNFRNIPPGFQLVLPPMKDSR